MISGAKISRILVRSVMALLLAAIALKALFFGNYKIPQNGMYPSLPAGSRIWTSKHAYKTVSDVKHGDVIVFNVDEGGGRYVYVWRVIALPGETVHAAGESLSINGRPVQRDAAREVAGIKLFREQIEGASYEIAFGENPSGEPPEVSITVPKNHLFVMGDNRNDSRDSRYLGPIAFDSIVGKKL